MRKRQWLLIKSSLKAELYRKLLKQSVDIYDSHEIGMSNTSTSSFMYREKYKLSRSNRLIQTYGKGNMNHIHAFVKISEIQKEKCNLKIHNCPNLKEIELFNVTNKLIDNGVLNSFVYCFNKLLLNKNYATFEKKTYAVLITEDISSDYIELTTFIRKNTQLPECILFELVYTLHTLNVIKMKHMDLHGANIYIKTLPKSEHKVIKYEAVVNNKLHSFYVRTTHVIKIIDLDSGNKMSDVSNHLKNEFKDKINNPYKFTGKTKTNSKSNILKLVHTLIRSNPIKEIANQLYFSGIRSSSASQSVPFFPNANSIQMNRSLYNNYYLKNYGLLISRKCKKTRFLNIPDTIIYSPERILFEMIQIGIFSRQSRYSIKYSQYNLYKT